MLARDNPYATEHVLRVRYRPQGVKWPELYARLGELRYHAAIVGPEGSGKTTLLEDLEPHLRSLGLTPHWLWLNLQDRRPAPGFWRQPLGPGDALLVDGAEVLSPLDWWRLRHHARTAGAFLLTLHRPGRLPTLLHTGTGPTLLTELVAELGQEISRADAEALWHETNGNLREALRFLYDRAGK
jgi:hypothetical protein